jgi:hypothetical protein
MWLVRRVRFKPEAGNAPIVLVLVVILVLDLILHQSHRRRCTMSGLQRSDRGDIMRFSRTRTTTRTSTIAMVRPIATAAGVLRSKAVSMERCLACEADSGRQTGLLCTSQTSTGTAGPLFWLSPSPSSSSLSKYSSQVPTGRPRKRGSAPQAFCLLMTSYPHY